MLSYTQAPVHAKPIPSALTQILDPSKTLATRKTRFLRAVRPTAKVTEAKEVKKLMKQTRQTKQLKANTTKSRVTKPKTKRNPKAKQKPRQKPGLKPVSDVVLHLDSDASIVQDLAGLPEATRDKLAKDEDTKMEDCMIEQHKSKYEPESSNDVLEESSVLYPPHYLGSVDQLNLMLLWGQILEFHEKYSENREDFAINTLAPQFENYITELSNDDIAKSIEDSRRYYSALDGLLGLQKSE